MDATRFDHLAQSVAGATRRSLLGALTALPLVGGLLALVGEEEADAHGRRKRRKKRHKYGKGRRRTNRRSKRRFRPEAVAQTCAGTCGSVLNNCRKTVDCGSCACDPTCAACFTCQELPGMPGSCVVDPAQQGQTCGAPGQVCQPDGSCACDASSCSNPTPICDGGVCLTCGDSNACTAAGLGDLCCGGSCFSGVCCTDAACEGDAAAPDCIGHDCVCATNGDTACADGETCCPAGCEDLQTDSANCGECGHACLAGQVCQGGICGVICGSDFCPAATEICDEGSCRACSVCAEGCTFSDVRAAVQAAKSGDTITICAGTYSRQGPGYVIAPVSVKDLTLIGAGTGENGTILDGGGVDSDAPVVSFIETTSELRALVIRGSKGRAGIFNLALSLLTLTDVLVTGNESRIDAGGGIYNAGNVVLNAGTRVTGNHAPSGGGIDNDGGSDLTLKAGSSVTNNSADPGFPAGIRNAGHSDRRNGEPGGGLRQCFRRQWLSSLSSHGAVASYRYVFLRMV